LEKPSRIVKEFEKMRHVLFLCVQNAARSQMAEAFFNALAKGKAVAKSAGDKPAERVNPLAVQAMKEVGIDISGNKPKKVTAEMAEEADVVVLMGCPENACPITPKEVVDWQIEDPVGKPIGKVREIRDEIRRKVEELLDDLGLRSS
jgi:protein-tyrosine-phosphatase